MKYMKMSFISHYCSYSILYIMQLQGRNVRMNKVGGEELKHAIAFAVLSEGSQKWLFVKFSSSTQFLFSSCEAVSSQQQKLWALCQKIFGTGSCPSDFICIRLLLLKDLRLKWNDEMKWELYMWCHWADRTVSYNGYRALLMSLFRSGV